MVKRNILQKEGVEISERDELLLCRYFDGEAGLWSRFRAKRIISHSAAAQEFYGSLDKIKGVVSANSGAQTDDVADLWDKISARLDSEERAAFYLGERHNSSHEQNRSYWHNFISSQALWGGLSGAATTALVLLFVAARPNSDSSLAAVQGDLRSSPQNGFRQIALGNPMSFIDNGGRQSSLLHQARSMTIRDRDALSARPRMLTERSSSMEVDWMRSNGPLKLIQNPSEQSTIIWVKRRSTLPTQDTLSESRQQGGKPEVVFTSGPGSLDSPARYSNLAAVK